MILSRKEFKTCIEELKDLISKTEDEKLKKDYSFFLFQLNQLPLSDKKDNREPLSYTKKLRELESLYQDNKDLYKVIIDYHNSLFSDFETIKEVNMKYNTIDYPKQTYTKKQSVALARNFYQNLDSDFLEIVDDILNKKTLTFRKRFSKDYQGMNYFIGGLNKNYIDIRKEGDLSDYLTIVHEFGHAINNIYNPMGFYEYNIFAEFVSIFVELVAIYEGRNLFNENILVYHTIDDFQFYYGLIESFHDQKRMIDVMYFNQFNKFNKKFIKEVNNKMNLSKKDIKETIDVHFYHQGDYAISFIMALELLYIYKHNKKEALELLKELMHKLPLNNQMNEVSKYLEPNVHAYTETKEIIDHAEHVIKKTL